MSKRFARSHHGGRVAKDAVTFTNIDPKDMVLEESKKSKAGKSEKGIHHEVLTTKEEKEKYRIKDPIVHLEDGTTIEVNVWQLNRYYTTLHAKLVSYLFNMYILVSDFPAEYRRTLADKMTQGIIDALTEYNSFQKGGAISRLYNLQDILYTNRDLLIIAGWLHCYKPNMNGFVTEMLYRGEELLRITQGFINNRKEIVSNAKNPNYKVKEMEVIIKNPSAAPIDTNITPIPPVNKPNVPALQVDKKEEIKKINEDPHVKELEARAPSEPSKLKAIPEIAKKNIKAKEEKKQNLDPKKILEGNDNSSNKKSKPQEKQKYYPETDIDWEHPENNNGKIFLNKLGKRVYAPYGQVKSYFTLSQQERDIITDTNNIHTELGGTHVPIPEIVMDGITMNAMCKNTHIVVDPEDNTKVSTYALMFYDKYTIDTYREHPSMRPAIGFFDTKYVDI